MIFHNRWVHRPDMDWNKAELRKKEGSIENKLFSGLKQMAKVRKQQRALHSASKNHIIVLPHDSVFAMGRVADEDRLLMVSNFCDQDVYIQNQELPHSWQKMNMKELFSTETQPPTSPVHLSPYGFKWFEPDI